MNQTSLKNKSYSLYELARIFESTNNIRIKITSHRIIRDGCIWEEISHMNTCWLTQVADSFQVWNAASNGVFKENV